MEKLESKSLDMISENIDKLKDLFPEAFKEGKIDFEALRLVLGDEVETEDERYNFTWHGKSDAVKLALKRSTGTLKPCKEESKDWDTTKNIFIEGDNLEVLRILQSSYRNKIKMIYIDPPYNTGSDFIYKDDFKDPIKNYKEQVGEVGKSNPETAGRYHTNWLNMMYPRLKLARNLLRDDGVIFISIGDREVHNLRKISDEIFGEENFIASLIWDKNVSAQAGIYKVYHEYILVYSKNIANVKVPNSLKNDEFSAAAIKKISGRHPATKFRFPKGTRFEAPNGTSLPSEYGNTIKVKVIEGKMEAYNKQLINEVVLEAGFTQAKQMYEYFYGDKNNLFDTQGQKIVDFFFNSSGKIQVIKKRSVEAPQTTCKFGTQASATSEIQNLFNTEDSPFSSPKPVSMVKDFINRFTDPSDIILDFFAGSATTAQAIFESNYEKSTYKKFILVQLDEDLNQKIKSAQKDSVNTLKAAIEYLKNKSKPLTIAEISKERIRRAGEKIKSENPSAQGSLFDQDKDISKLDIGFKVFKLDDTNFTQWDETMTDAEEALLRSVQTLKPNCTQEDALYEILLKYGIDISLPITEQKILGKKVFSLADNYLLICLEKNLCLEVIEAIANLKPERVVFYDDGFADDVVKLNAEQTLIKAGVKDLRVI